MLLDKILSYCDGKYQECSGRRPCPICRHPTGVCSGNCEKCLEQVHYPYKYPDGKKDYDCQNMLNFYACKYLYKYTSEICHLINRSSMVPSVIDEYHILSIGCGASPDLAAFEKYILDTMSGKTISYVGCDVNPLWGDIHGVVDAYVNQSQVVRKCKFIYDDALSLLREGRFGGTNIIVMQYLISHLYNTGQIGMVDSFFDTIIRNVISCKEKNNPLVIMINDVNSCHRGRDCFYSLAQKLKAAKYDINVEALHFPYGQMNSGQQYGSAHSNTGILFNVPQAMKKYNPWEQCSSAQLLIEVK